MTRFFRTIRQKLLTEDTVSKYLVYAIGIGEIIDKESPWSVWVMPKMPKTK